MAEALENAIFVAESTLPDCNNPPPLLSEQPCYSGISPLVSENLPFPKFSVGRWQFSSLAVGMVVPETAMDKNNGLCWIDNEIRLSGNRLYVATISYFKLTQQTGNGILRRGITPLDEGHYFASFGLCIHIYHVGLPQDISGELFTTCMYFVVAFAAQNYEVLFDIGPARSMFLDMVKLENSWVFPRPFFSIPPTKATRVIVPFIYSLLNFEWYAAVVRFGDSIFILKNILTHS